MRYGVKEYWIADPETKKIIVYTKTKKGVMPPAMYTFEDKIKVSIFEDFEINFKELNFIED